jgi:hypothetical protein
MSDQYIIGGASLALRAGPWQRIYNFCAQKPHGWSLVWNWVLHFQDLAFCSMANLSELRASCKEGDIELVNMSQQRLLEFPKPPWRFQTREWYCKECSDKMDSKLKNKSKRKSAKDAGAEINGGNSIKEKKNKKRAREADDGYFSMVLIQRRAIEITMML